MDARPERLLVPRDCALWCQSQDYGVTVGDDLAEVDLDWWNTRLEDHHIPVRLWGRDPDGAPVDQGKAFLRRDDLTGQLPCEGSADLGVLYQAAAWLSAHRRRAHKRCFVDVRSVGAGATDFKTITTALRLCREQHPAALDHGPHRSWSGWPQAPGVGPVLMSLYCWAVHPGQDRPQLLDPYSLATLCWLGWLELPSVAHFTTRNRYLRYCALLHDWAGQAEVPAELIEMWLATNWWERIQRTGHYLHTDQL